MAAEDLKEVACTAIDRAQACLLRVSDAIWKKPELGFEEHEAHAQLTSILKEYGFLVDEHYTLETAFRARVGDEIQKGIHVAIMCEYDALPGIGHACGHNLIAEAGVAAGIGLKAAFEASDVPLGRLTVYGTPAEEGGGGKIEMIKSGCFSDVDFAMMVHPCPVDLVDALFMALDELKITYTGRASHAAAFPWEGVNALDAAVAAYNGISMLRQQMKPTWRVHGVITNGGAKPNIIPEKSELQFYIRAPTAAELKVLKEKTVAVFQASGQASGCSVDIQSVSSYSDLISNTDLLQLYTKNAEKLGVEFSDSHPMVRSLRSMPVGSTDMGDVSYVVPSIHPNYSIGGTAVNHTKDFTETSNTAYAHQRTLIAAKAMAMTAIDVLVNPITLDSIKATFKRQTNAAASKP